MSASNRTRASEMWRFIGMMFAASALMWLMMAICGLPLGGSAIAAGAFFVIVTGTVVAYDRLKYPQ